MKKLMMGCILLFVFNMQAYTYKFRNATEDIIMIILDYLTRTSPFDSKTEKIRMIIEPGKDDSFDSYVAGECITNITMKQIKEYNRENYISSGYSEQFITYGDIETKDKSGLRCYNKKWKITKKQHKKGKKKGKFYYDLEND